MGKKVFFAITGGLALLGLAVAIVGFALGGRPGGVVAMDGKLVYFNSREAIPLADVPDWWRWNWHGWGWTYGDWNNNGAFVSSDGDILQENPARADEVEKVSVNISVGRVVIIPGDTPGITADGFLDYSSEFRDGVWNIRSVLPDGDLKDENGRFWLNGRDITTTFTITVPQDMQSLELRLGAGHATVDDLTLDRLDCQTDMGRLEVAGVAAEESRFDVDMGNITAIGLSGRRAEMDCDLGSIRLEGDVTERVVAKCNLGSIAIVAARPSRYSGKAEADLGTVKVDGQGTRGEFSGSFENAQSDASPYFELDCDLGGIDLSFS